MTSRLPPPAEVNAFELTKAQDKAMNVLISDASHIALGGGSRCVSGDTIIDGQTLTIKELAKIGKPIIVITSHGKQWAEAPFKKGSAVLLEVVTESGKRIEVTSDHRFWNGERWIYARDVTVGSSLAGLLCEQNLQGSSSERDLSKSLEDAHYLTKTLEGYQGGYSLCRHQYDQQPHLCEVYGLTYRASPYDEQERSQINRCQPYHVSVLHELNSHKHYPSSLGLECNQNDPQSFHLSTSGDSPSSYLAFEYSDLYAGQTCERFQHSHLGDQKSLSQLAPHKSNQLHFDIDREGFYQFFCHDTYLTAYNDTPLLGGYKLEKVSSVTETSKKDYYTLHVPSTEQYFANGLLHHNSGKTFLLVRAVIIRALKAPESRHVIFRFRFNAIKASIILDTLPKVMKLCFPGLMSNCNLNKTDWYLTLPNGSEIWFGGLDDKERAEKILGMEFATLYFNECSQIPWQSIILALTRLAQKTTCLRLKAFYDFNPPSKKHWTFLRFVEKRNPENKQPERNPFDFGFYLINPADNAENLDPKYIAFLDALPEKARNRFLLGRFADDTDGQLWSEEVLATNRRLGQEGTLPQWLRVVIAVDPSGCSGDEDFRSDEIGIVVAALGTDSHGYIIEDLSGRYSPEQWADIVNEAYVRHSADRVVGEKNFGGDMVRAVLQAKNPLLPYQHVIATRGKVVRAEPIAALDELGKVHHVGYFTEMEDQLCAMTTGGYMGLRSPDRADARIWALTELFPSMTRKAKDANWTPPAKLIGDRSASRFDSQKKKSNRSASRFDKPSRKW